eukprot:4815990-Amphidinium_carterae.2
MTLVVPIEQCIGSSNLLSVVHSRFWPQATANAFKSMIASCVPGIKETLLNATLASDQKGIMDKLNSIQSWMAFKPLQRSGATLHGQRHDLVHDSAPGEPSVLHMVHSGGFPRLRNLAFYSPTRVITASCSCYAFKAAWPSS